MKFAIVCFSDKSGNFSDFLPLFLKQLYYLKIRKSFYKEINIISSEGIFIDFPFKADDYICAKLFKELKKREVCCVSANKYLESIEGINISDGKALLCMLLDKIINIACRIKNKSFEELNIVVVDSENNLINIIINKIAKKATKVWLYTLRANELENLFDYVFKNNGLCIGAFSSLNSSLIQNADIVIDTKNYNYKSLPQNVVYVDITENRSFTNRIIRTRKDITVLRDFEIIYNDEHISLKDAEAALSALNRNFNKLVFGKFFGADFERADDFVDKLNIKLARVTKQSS